MRAPIPFVLSRSERRRLHDRAYRAQQRDQSEIGGALVLDAEHRLSLGFLPNLSSAPGRFELSLSDLAKVRSNLRRDGRRVAGLFHSHPIWYARPGSGDIRGARLNALMLIYDVCGRDVGLWRIVRKGRRRRAVSVPLRFDDYRRG